MDSAQSAALSASPWRAWSAHSHAEVAFLLGERRAAERVTRRLFGRVLRPSEYAGLAGAPDDAKVEVGASDGKLYLELRDRVAAAYRGYYYVYCTKAARVLLNDGLRIHVEAMQGHGLGLQMFYRQARNAAAMGIDRIEAVAGRRHDENGYYTWPRYGFQGVLPRPVRHLLPVGLTHGSTILDVMSCEKGRDWWKEHGVTVAVRFDLAPGSRSRRTLARYVRERRCGRGPRTTRNSPSA